MPQRTYTATVDIGGSVEEIPFTSRARKGSRANAEDARRAVLSRKGRYVADRADVLDVRRDAR